MRSTYSPAGYSLQCMRSALKNRAIRKPCATLQHAYRVALVAWTTIVPVIDTHLM
jgi:hypothetical protein